jgi:hypothetical protein
MDHNIIIHKDTFDKNKKCNDHIDISNNDSYYKDISNNNHKNNDNDNYDNIDDDTIEHLVLSGGAYLGLYEFGALKYLANRDFFSMDNIKTIHGTSIGGLLGVMLSLKIGWDDLTEYFIKRPWYKMVQMNPNMFFDVIPNKGLLGKSFFISMFEPIFKSLDIKLSITLKELYEVSKIELFLYSVNLNNYTLEQLSYKTNPHLSVIDAIHMTCALPYIFQPVWYNNSFHIDGSLINNYPLIYCIDYITKNNKFINKNKILGIKLENYTGDKIVSKENMNIFEYGYLLYKQMMKSSKDIDNPTIKNELVIPCNSVNISEGYKVIMEPSKREEYINDGEKFASVFIKYNS